MDGLADILKNYAKHYKTGEPMPKDLLDKVAAANKFNQGFKTTEYLAATLLDQAWHQLKPAEVPNDALAFEAEALKKAGVDFAVVPPRYRTHVFLAHLLGRLFGRLLLLPLERSPRCRYGRLVQGERRTNRRTATTSANAALARRQRRRHDLFRNFAGRAPNVQPLLKRRGLDDGPAQPSAR